MYAPGQQDNPPDGDAVAGAAQVVSLRFTAAITPMTTPLTTALFSGRKMSGGYFGMDDSRTIPVAPIRTRLRM